MAVFAAATFTGTDWQTINAVGASVGGPIYDHVDEDGNWYVYQNKAYSPTPGLTYWNGTPSDADYSVTADVVIKSSAGSTGVAGRISPTQRTYYAATIEATTGKIKLWKRVNGVMTTLTSLSATSYGVGTHELTLDMVGTTIRALIGGVQILTATDSSITAAGKAGIIATIRSESSTGKHLDNFIADDAAAASTARSSIVGLVGL